MLVVRELLQFGEFSVLLVVSVCLVVSSILLPMSSSSDRTEACRSFKEYVRSAKEPQQCVSSVIFFLNTFCFVSYVNLLL